MVTIRLARHGTHKRPFYRVVVAEARTPRDGRFIETVGRYNPLTNPPTVELDNERITHWIGVGARPSETVGNLLKAQARAAAAAAAPAAKKKAKA